MLCGVTDSRPRDNGAYIRRRRRCDACAFRFTTHEKPVANDEDHGDRLAMFNALMAQSMALADLARTVMSPQMAASYARYYDAYGLPPDTTRKNEDDL